eukprot:TRINITY_DN9240_c0_g1_i1.p1 TRINITY_DN9240_c0_g1~~TRINITY_DN9240_c0_g1_i1.p1  ORF type:complete len:1952 (+),score=596.96 TRINITY_DN9240_c0_g1_i1:112-5856(+)
MPSKWDSLIQSACADLLAEEYPSGILREPRGAPPAGCVFGGPAQRFLCGALLGVSQRSLRLVPSYAWGGVLRELLQYAPASGEELSSVSDSLSSWQAFFSRLVSETASRLADPGAGHTRAALARVCDDTWCLDGVLFRRVKANEVDSFRRAKHALEAVASARLPHLAVPTLTLGWHRGCCFAAVPLLPLKQGATQCVGPGFGIVQRDRALKGTLRALARCLSVPFTALPTALSGHYGADGQVWIIDAGGLPLLLPPGAGEPSSDQEAHVLGTATTPVALHISFMKLLGAERRSAVPSPPSLHCLWGAPASPPPIPEPSLHLPPPRERTGLGILLSIAEDRARTDPEARPLVGTQLLRLFKAGTVCGMGTISYPEQPLSPRASARMPPVEVFPDTAVSVAEFCLGRALPCAVAALLAAAGADDVAPPEDLEVALGVAPASAEVSVSKLLHRRGLSVRLCGKLWNLVAKMQAEAEAAGEAAQVDVCKAAQKLLATEMVARGLKHWLRQRWESQCSNSADCYNEVDKLFAGLLRSDSRRKSVEAGAFFGHEVIPVVGELFGDVRDAGQLLGTCDRLKVYFQLCLMCGIHVKNGKVVSIQPTVQHFKLPDRQLPTPGRDSPEQVEATLKALQAALRKPFSRHPFSHWPTVVAICKMTLASQTAGATDTAIESVRSFHEAVALHEKGLPPDQADPYVQMLTATLLAQTVWALRRDARVSAEDFGRLLQQRQEGLSLPGLDEDWRHESPPGRLTSWDHADVVLMYAQLRFHTEVDPSTSVFESAVPAAAPALQRILAALNSAGVDWLTAPTPAVFALYGLAHVDAKRGSIDTAIASYEKSLRLWEAAEGPLDGQVARCLYHLGKLYKANDRWKDSEMCFIRSLNIVRAEPVEDVERSASAMNNLAFLYFYSDQDVVRRRALPLFQKCLQTALQLHGEVSYAVATFLNNIGSVHYRSKEFNTAEEVFQRALLVSRSLQPPDHSGIRSCEQHIRLCQARRRAHAALVIQRHLRGFFARKRAKALRGERAGVLAGAVEADEALEREEVEETEAAERAVCAEARVAEAAVRTAIEEASRREDQLSGLVSDEGESRAGVEREEAAAAEAAHSSHQAATVARLAVETASAQEAEVIRQQLRVVGEEAAGRQVVADTEGGAAAALQQQVAAAAARAVVEEAAAKEAALRRADVEQAEGSVREKVEESEGERRVAMAEEEAAAAAVRGALEKAARAEAELAERAAAAEADEADSRADVAASEESARGFASEAFASGLAAREAIEAAVRSEAAASALVDAIAALVQEEQSVRVALSASESPEFSDICGRCVDQLAAASAVRYAVAIASVREEEDRGRCDAGDAESNERAVVYHAAALSDCECSEATDRRGVAADEKVQRDAQRQPLTSLKAEQEAAAQKGAADAQREKRWREAALALGDEETMARRRLMSDESVGRAGERDTLTAEVKQLWRAQQVADLVQLGVDAAVGRGHLESDEADAFRCATVSKTVVPEEGGERTRKSQEETRARTGVCNARDAARQEILVRWMRAQVAALLEEATGRMDEVAREEWKAWDALQDGWEEHMMPLDTSSPTKRGLASPRYWVDQYIDMDHGAPEDEQERELLRRLRAVEKRLEQRAAASPGGSAAPVALSPGQAEKCRVAEAAAAHISDALAAVPAQFASAAAGIAVLASQATCCYRPAPAELPRQPTPPTAPAPPSAPAPPPRPAPADIGTRAPGPEVSPARLPPLREEGLTPRPPSGSTRSRGSPQRRVVELPEIRPLPKGDNKALWAEVYRVSVRLDQRLRSDLVSAPQAQTARIQTRQEDVRRVIDACRNMSAVLPPVDTSRANLLREANGELLQQPVRGSKGAWASPSPPGRDRPELAPPRPPGAPHSATARRPMPPAAPHVPAPPAQPRNVHSASLRHTR